MIKYYLREGMLYPGRRGSSPNQIDYADSHLTRLRLLRALSEQGQLQASAIKRILESVDSGAPLAQVLGRTQDAVVDTPPVQDSRHAEEANAILTELVSTNGWKTGPDNPGWNAAVNVLTSAKKLGNSKLIGLLETYAHAVENIADAEAHAVLLSRNRDQIVEDAVATIALGAKLLLALRVMAEESASLKLLDR